MRRFRFRLESVLQVREALEKQREQEYQAALGVVQIAVNHMQQLQQSFQHTLSGRPGVLPGERFDAPSIRDRERYLSVLQTMQEEQMRVLEAAQANAEEKRRVLVTARQAREAVSTLKQRDLSLYEIETRKQEQDALDEAGALRHGRNTPASQKEAA